MRSPRAAIRADAARLLGSAGARASADDYKLWVGLGNALVDHAGTLTPAARLAFARAARARARLSRAAFLPRAGAKPVPAIRRRRCVCGSEILANAPADASWRPMVEDGCC